MIELRELKSADIFPMIQILNKIGFRELKEILTPEKIKEMMKTFKEAGSEKEESEKEESEKDQADPKTILGFNLIIEVVGVVMNNLPSCQTEIYKFMSNLSGLSVKDLEELPMADFAEMIIDLIQKQEFKDFFKAVSKLFN